MTTLTMKDEKRLDVIQRVYRSELTVIEAAQILNISERQCYRVKARVKKAGAKGVIHGNRGRPGEDYGLRLPEFVEHHFQRGYDDRFERHHHSRSRGASRRIQYRHGCQHRRHHDAMISTWVNNPCIGKRKGI